MGNNFVIYLAGLAPKVEVGEVEISDKNGNIYQLEISIKNTGFLPTETEQAQNMEIDEPVLLTLEPDDNVEILFGEKKVKIGQIEGFSESEKLTYIVRVKNRSEKAGINAVVKSQRAGTASKLIEIK